MNDKQHRIAQTTGVAADINVAFGWSPMHACELTR